MKRALLSAAILALAAGAAIDVQAQTRFELKGVRDDARTTASVLHACANTATVGLVVEVWPDKVKFYAADDIHGELTFSQPRLPGQPVSLTPFQRLASPTNIISYSGEISAEGVPTIRTAGSSSKCAWIWTPR